MVTENVLLRDIAKNPILKKCLTTHIDVLNKEGLYHYPPPKINLGRAFNVKLDLLHLVLRPC